MTNWPAIAEKRIRDQVDLNILDDLENRQAEPSVTRALARQHYRLSATVSALEMMAAGS